MYMVSPMHVAAGGLVSEAMQVGEIAAQQQLVGWMQACRADSRFRHVP
jgi:hypothetical protein